MWRTDHHRRESESLRQHLMVQLAGHDLLKANGISLVAVSAPTPLH
jgi:hypothetical protein